MVEGFFEVKKMRNAHAREASIRGYDTLIVRGKKSPYLFVADEVRA